MPVRAWADRPSSPGQPSVTSITRRSVVLSWYGCCYYGGSSVTGYTIELQHIGLPASASASASVPVSVSVSVPADDDASSRSTDDHQQWHVVTDYCQVHSLLVLSSSSSFVERRLNRSTEFIIRNFISSDVEKKRAQIKSVI